MFFAIPAMNGTLPAELKFMENTAVLWELNSSLTQIMLSFVLTKIICIDAGHMSENTLQLYPCSPKSDQNQFSLNNISM